MTHTGPRPEQMCKDNTIFVEIHVKPYIFYIMLYKRT